MNKIIFPLIPFLSVIFFFSCSENNSVDKLDYIIAEKDIIPEGVAFDPNTQTIYISSTWKKKIVQIDKEGKISDFINEGQDEIKSVIGMEVDTKSNSLWAVSSEANEVLPLRNPGDKQWRSSIYQFDLAGGNLIGKYELKDDSLFLNDLTVAEDGIVYITESRGNAIYQVVPGNDSITLFCKITPYQFMNGICFAGNKDHFFVSSKEGIISVDTKTRNYFLLPSPDSVKTGAIDGLSFHNNYFIAHQSSKIVRLYLSEENNRIIGSNLLDSGIEFDSSTTGEVSGDYYYYIVNSQIQSGVDYKKQMIKPIDSLENIIIRRIRL